MKNQNFYLECETTPHLNKCFLKKKEKRQKVTQMHVNVHA